MTVTNELFIDNVKLSMYNMYNKNYGFLSVIKILFLQIFFFTNVLLLFITFSFCNTFNNFFSQNSNIFIYIFLYFFIFLNKNKIFPIFCHDSPPYFLSFSSLTCLSLSPVSPPSP